MKKYKKAPKRTKKVGKAKSSKPIRKTTVKRKSVFARKKLSSRKSTVKTAVLLSVDSHLKVEKPKVIAPSSNEKSLAFKTLNMLYQGSGFSGDESRIFRDFLDRFKEGDMKKEDLYEFLMGNPSIRRKFWESDVFG